MLRLLPNHCYLAEFSRTYAWNEADRKKHKGSASLAFVRGIHRWLEDSPQEVPVIGKMFPFDDVIIKRYVTDEIRLLIHDVGGYYRVYLYRSHIGRVGLWIWIYIYIGIRIYLYRMTNSAEFIAIWSSSSFAWSSIAQSVCQRAFSLLAIWCLGSRVQILLSAEEHNLSPFDLNIACLCQSIEINNNKYEYRQSQVRKSTDSGVRWAECSLIIVTGCRVQVFAWSSIAQSVCQRAFSLLAIWCLGSRVQILLSAEGHNLSPFDLNIACLCQSIEIKNNKYILVLEYIYTEWLIQLSFLQYGPLCEYT